MLKRFTSIFDQKKGPKLSDKYILAVSGGMDSMCLLFLMRSLGMDVIAAHVNYNFRPSSTLESLCAKREALRWGIPFHCLFLDGQNKELWKGNRQNLARLYRYRFFRKVKEKTQAQWIVLAHHQNDQLETFFLQAMRGTSSRGLSGMKTIDGDVIRPLLSFSKDEIEAYVRSNAIRYVDDESNQSLAYRRNRIRQWLQGFDGEEPSIRQGVIRTIYWQQQTDAFVEEELRKYKSQHYSPLQAGGWIRGFPNIPSLILGRWLVDLGMYPDQIKALYHATDRAIFPVADGAVIQKVGRDLLYLRCQENNSESVIFYHWSMLSTMFAVEFGLLFNANCADAHPTASFVLSELCFPLKWTAWRPGDRIESMGLGGRRQKVKDILTDAGVPGQLKPLVYVLRDRMGQILWIPGYKRSRHALVGHRGNSPILTLALYPLESSLP